MDYGFKNKKITLMGLGLLGRGVGDARFLAEQGAELIVTDIKTEEELKSSIGELEGFSNITFRLGGHDISDFQGRDLIIRAANVPLDSVYLKEAEKHSIPITQSAVLFAEHTKGTIVGVTGTRGKSTVTQMIFELLKADGRTVYLGGNVRGVSTLALLPEVKEGDYCVLELDSWQLASFGDKKMSPHVAIFTTFMPDHMNYYMKGGLSLEAGMDWYLKDKANIFRYQVPGDILVMGLQAEELLKEDFGKEMLGEQHTASDVDIPHDWELSIPGLHNRYNAGIARVTARALNISDEIIKKILTHFACLPGRLECVREIKGVRIYNDTNSTTPDATIAALESFPAGKIVLIAGGADKSLSLPILAEEIQDRTKGVVFLSGTGTEKLKEFFEPGTYVETNDVKEAVSSAFALTKEGDTVVFSPGFASFGMFLNEYDRGEKFIEIVKGINK